MRKAAKEEVANSKLKMSVVVDSARHLAAKDSNGNFFGGKSFGVS